MSWSARHGPGHIKTLTFTSFIWFSNPGSSSFLDRKKSGKSWVIFLRDFPWTSRILIAAEKTYYYPLESRLLMGFSYPISSISRIFFNGTPVVLFTALFLKGCGHDFPWRISKREMAMYGESSFNALQLIFHFSTAAWCPHAHMGKNSRILWACWKIWKISLGFFWCVLTYFLGSLNGGLCTTITIYTTLSF